MWTVTRSMARKMPPPANGLPDRIYSLGANMVSTGIMEAG